MLCYALNRLRYNRLVGLEFAKGEAGSTFI